MKIPKVIRVVGTFGGMVAIVAFLAHRWALQDRKYQCFARLSHVILTMQQYTLDHGKYPSVDGSSYFRVPGPPFYGWADALETDSRNLMMLHADTFGFPTNRTNPSLKNFTHYWINRNLSGHKPSAFKHPKITLAFGEGQDENDLSNARYSLSRFPDDWFTNRESPMYRHYGGAHYAFCDGHVEWLRPEEVRHYGGRADPFAID